MANGQGLRKLGDLFQQYTTGIGALLGLTKPYNPDQARYDVEQAQIALQMQALQAEQSKARNQTILYIVLAIVGVVFLAGAGYYAFKD